MDKFLLKWTLPNLWKKTFSEWPCVHFNGKHDRLVTTRYITTSTKSRLILHGLTLALFQIHIDLHDTLFPLPLSFSSFFHLSPLSLSLSLFSLSFLSPVLLFHRPLLTQESRQNKKKKQMVNAIFSIIQYYKSSHMHTYLAPMFILFISPMFIWNVMHVTSHTVWKIYCDELTSPK